MSHATKVVGQCADPNRFAVKLVGGGSVDGARGGMRDPEILLSASAFKNLEARMKL
jgi:hypothetical protein